MQDEAEIDMCFKWMNILPLEKIKNIRKSNKILPWRIFHLEMKLRQFAVQHPELQDEIYLYIKVYSIKLANIQKSFCATRPNSGKSLRANATTP
jgi:hypothetical protein